MNNNLFNHGFERLFIPSYGFAPLEDHSDDEAIHDIGFIPEALPCATVQEADRLIQEQIQALTRNVVGVVWHCTATHLSATNEAILRYWTNNKGWRNPGYHISINCIGHMHLFLDFNGISNGVGGMNSRIINIATIGGLTVDDRTEEQKYTQWALFEAFQKYAPHLWHDGHRSFANKACPRYVVKEFFGI